MDEAKHATIWAGRDFEDHLVHPPTQSRANFKLDQVAQGLSNTSKNR